MTAYYNEHDAKAAQWLRELGQAALVPAGLMDERDIQEVKPDDVREARECHFFAGIGGWPLALRLAGWSANEPVWTGSCPCQPFSGAGKKKGKADPRHLWPVFRELIAECRPATIFGEQVASDLGVEWLAGVRVDLEALGYAVGAADLCAPCVGSPHIRQRLFWVADSSGNRRNDKRRNARRKNASRESRWSQSVNSGTTRRLEHSASNGRLERRPEPDGLIVGRCSVGGLGYTLGAGREGFWPSPGSKPGSCPDGGPPFKAGPWSDFDIIRCRDGKARRVESGTFPLAHGIPGRVGLLRGYGNAIVPQVAATFIKAYLDIRYDLR